MLRKLLQIGAATGLGLMLAACGGSSSPEPTATTPPPTAAPPTAPATGTVGILFTDAPTNEFAEILVTVTEISLLPPQGGDEPVELFSGEQTFDLLQLRDFTDPFIFVEGVPVGEYEKIRLRVTRIQLVRERDEDGVITDSEDAKITGNGKLDLNPRGTFEVEGGQTLLIRIDIDAKKSVLVVGAGRSGQYIFRPVVFVNIDRGDLPDRLVRLYGTIGEDFTDGFELCELRRIQDLPPILGGEAGEDSGGPLFPGGCVDILVDTDTGLFDNADGQPLALDSLAQASLATAIGFFTPPTEGVSRRSLAALVVQVGDRADLSILTGEVDSASQDLEFNLVESFDPLEQRTVKLFEKSAFIDREGVRYLASQISLPVDVRVEGVVLEAAPDELLASLVVASLRDDLVQESLTGTVLAVDGRVLTVSPQDSGDRCVRVREDAAITRGIEDLDFEDLAVDQQIEAFGNEALDGCFNATTIVVEEAE